jgi:hypothetical protein
VCETRWHRSNAAILAQALRDAQNPHVPPAIRAQARAFLAGSDGLHFWCDVAGLRADFGAGTPTRIPEGAPLTPRRPPPGDSISVIYRVRLEPGSKHSHTDRSARQQSEVRLPLIHGLRHVHGDPGCAEW